MTDQNVIKEGYCHCGCGGKTNIAKRNNKRLGWTKGKPVRFISGHHKGHLKNYKNITKDTIYLYMPSHPNANKNRYVREHLTIVEKAISKILKKSVVIHHVDGNPHNNENSNLVACENKAYHNLIHARKRAYEACGHAEWLKCQYCREYDKRENLYISKNSGWVFHQICSNKYRKKLYHKNKIARGL